MEVPAWEVIEIPSLLVTPEAALIFVFFGKEGYWEQENFIFFRIFLKVWIFGLKV